jgi:hypothetical protein
MTENLYFKIRDEARKIATTLPVPSFYEDYKTAVTYSNIFFEENPDVKSLKDFVYRKLENNFGHGFMHAKKVAVDAGAILIAEKGVENIDDDLLIMQCSGLFHDIIRKTENHALESSVYSERKLRDFPLKKSDIDTICKAIRNHEAFKKNDDVFTENELLISNCLYDADKFRWGPDNFTHTVWDMVSYADVPLKLFMKNYPRGIDSLLKIKTSFRSDTGKKFGPEFIDLGLKISDQLLDYIKKNFSKQF